MAKDVVMSVRLTQAARDRLRREARHRGVSLSGLFLTAMLRELGWGDRTRVTYHHEDGIWWADSEDVPGYYACAATLEELRELVREGMKFHLIEEFYEDDKPIESVQGICSQPPDFVAGPSCSTLFVGLSATGGWMQQFGPRTFAGPGRWSAA